MSQPLLGLRGGDERIPASAHEQRYVEASRRLVDQSLLALTAKFSVEDVLRAIDRYRALRSARPCFPLGLFENAVALLCWAGDRDGAVTRIEWTLKEVAGWPEHVLRRNGGLAGWGNKLRGILECSDWESVVQTEVREHHLGDLPYAPLQRRG